MNVMDENRPAMTPARSDGPLARLLKKVLLRQSSIVAVDRLGEHFVRITLQGDALRNVVWTPGDKIQLSLSRGFGNRTYTPLYWDGERGVTAFVAYLHGDSATCDFFAAARPGMSVPFMGPRSSLDLGTASHALLFGDETCFGLAAAFHRAAGDGASEFVFETDDISQARQVLKALGIADATLVQRRADDSHLAAACAEILRLAPACLSFVLAGRAAAIQSVKRALHGAGLPNGQIRAKAYWAAGKRGLD